MECPAAGQEEPKEPGQPEPPEQPKPTPNPHLRSPAKLTEQKTQHNKSKSWPQQQKNLQNFCRGNKTSRKQGLKGDEE